MEASVSQETALEQIARKYRKLYRSLAKLIDTLNVLKLGGTLLDEVNFITKEDGKVQIAYAATPVRVTIHTPKRKLIVKVTGMALWVRAIQAQRLLTAS